MKKVLNDFDSQSRISRILLFVKKKNQLIIFECIELFYELLFVFLYNFRFTKLA